MTTELPAEGLDDISSTVSLVAIDVTPVLMAPKLEILPTHEMKWENFEVLLSRLAGEVAGLRRVRIYGIPGQTQHGIDVVGETATGIRTAIQSKRYQSFTDTDLAAAVKKYLDGNLPFSVSRLIVAAACGTNRTQVSNELIRLQQEHTGLEIEVWGQHDICNMLRSRPDIVTEFFGEPAAEIFCLPATPRRVVAAVPADRAQIADAALRGPAETTGAAARLAHAKSLEEQNPLAAAAELDQADRLLRERGFYSHADALSGRRAELRRRGGDFRQAADLLSAAFWRAMERAEADEAQQLARLLTRTADGDATAAATNHQAGQEDSLSGSSSKVLAVEDRSPQPRVAELANLASLAVAIDDNVLARVDLDLNNLLTACSAKNELAKLALLAAQIDGVNPLGRWRSENAEAMLRLAGLLKMDAVSGSDQEALALHLRIEAADALDRWGVLLHDANRRSISRPLSSIVYGRHAVQAAECGEFVAADDSWVAAMEQAMLEGDNEGASKWVTARRQLHSRFQPRELNDFYRVGQALDELPGTSTQRILRRTRERALSVPLDDKNRRRAATRLVRYLRMSRALGFWSEVLEARGRLAEVYARSGEYDLAAAHLAHTGETKRGKDLADRAGDQYIDVTHYLNDQPYWIRSFAFRLQAEQADLASDQDVFRIADAALQVLRDAAAGTLSDTPFIGPSVYEAAHTVLAALSARLEHEQAAGVLQLLAPLVPREGAEYRYTDDAHVESCVGIARAQPDLRPAAIDQLLDLLATGSTVGMRVEDKAQDVFCEHPGLVRSRLTELAKDGLAGASRLLANMEHDPDNIPAEQFKLAKEQLGAPLELHPGVYARGTGAIGQSLLARYLPLEERRQLIRTQLERVASQDELSGNRAEYLLAAANLADGIHDEKLFERAMEYAQSAEPTRADLAMSSGNYPLSSVRMNFERDIRSDALLLAAQLAGTTEQRRRVRGTAIPQIGLTPRSSYQVARILQILPEEELAAELPLLATQSSWALRSIAAIAWPKSNPGDDLIGMLLAKDTDPRVRRALAQSVASHDTTTVTHHVRICLAEDVRFSVRSLAAAPCE